MGKTNWERATTVFWRWYNTMGPVIPDSRKAELILGIERALNKADARKNGEPGYVLGIDTEHAEDYGTEAVFKNGIGVVSGFFKVPASVVNGHISSESESKYTVCQAEAFADDLVSAAYGVANYNSAENNRDLAELREAVVGAIAGSAKPQPEPQRYTKDEAVMLLYAMKDTASEARSKCSQESLDNALEARRAVIAAITGQPKPAPQFDAEKVKIMLGFLRNNTYAAGKYNHPIDNEASELVYHNILKALHIE